MLIQVNMTAVFWPQTRRKRALNDPPSNGEKRHKTDAVLSVLLDSQQSFDSVFSEDDLLAPPSPPLTFSNWTASAVLISLLPGSRSMCPSHLCLRSRMSATRSYVLVLGDASSWTLRPVIRLTQRALAPFMAAIVDSLRYHASLPYVKRLPTTHLYIFIFRLNAMPELRGIV